MSNDDELIEKRIELRQQLKTKLLTLSPSIDRFNSFNNFIPNNRDLDFIENYEQIQPYICSICEKDSTENWWFLLKNNNEKKNICDQCEQNRLRNLVLEQHRQSMKLAFLQAKESERRLEVDYQKQQKYS